MLERVERHNRAAAPGRRVQISVEVEKPREELLPLMGRGHVVRSGAGAMDGAGSPVRSPVLAAAKGVAGATSGRECPDLRGLQRTGCWEPWFGGVRPRGVQGLDLRVQAGSGDASRAQV